MFSNKPRIIVDKNTVDELLSRGVDMVYPDKDWLRTQLMSGRRLRIYTGWDPTSTDVHIGHTVWIWKLRAFQELGHEVIVLMGTFTATLGDPTGKESARKAMTLDETRKNAESFKKKTAKIFDVKNNPITIRENHKWLAEMSFSDVIKLASHFTVQQMLERDMFEKRREAGEPIGLHEFFYPLMQGYDSVAMEVDLEVGGTDQTFNMLAGRTLVRQMQGREKGVLTLKLITDAAGKKIGKSEGNAINIDAEPTDLYGKVMTLADETIWTVFEQCTPLALSDIALWKNEMENDPRRAKAKLAFEIVKLYNDETAARAAEEAWNRQFRDGEVPVNMQSFSIRPHMLFVDALVESGLCSSKGDARRQIEQNGVKLDGEVVSDVLAKAKHGVLQKGKRHFVRLI
ncbi:MAG: tyrosine--tRNA ligase [Patescibacteria group bacterium]